MIRLLALSLVAVLAPPALAQSSGAAGETAADDGGEVKCRSIFVVNSRIPERICRTKAEWARLSQESREAISQNRRTVGASGDD